MRTGKLMLPACKPGIVGATVCETLRLAEEVLMSALSPHMEWMALILHVLATLIG